MQDFCGSGMPQAALRFVCPGPCQRSHRPQPSQGLPRLQAGRFSRAS